jgi:hypothetical protein
VLAQGQVRALQRVAGTTALGTVGTEAVPRLQHPPPQARARSVDAACSPSPRSHMRRTRGCRCNAGRALPSVGHEHAGRASRSSPSDDWTSERKPSPPRAPHKLPRPPPFSFSGIFRMLRRAARREGKRERGRGTAATRSAPAAPRGRRAAAALPTARPARARPTPPRRMPSSLPLTTLWTRSPHLDGLPPQTLR